MRTLRRIGRWRSWLQWKLRRLPGQSRGGKVDFSAFEDVAAFYRRCGSKIGQKVRLLGAIDGVNPHLVAIGDYSVIGANSALLAHCPINGARPVSVGRFTYLAYGVLVLPGVSIGDFCVVGAGSVVTKSMPNGTVIAGNPARVIRTLTPEEKNRIETVMLQEGIFGWDPAGAQ